MRSFKERVVHTALFEVGAVVAVAPVIAAVTGTPLAEAGGLSLLLSAIATACNYGWTLLFDRWVPMRRRSLALRAGQAVGLELLISLFAIPLFVALAGASLAQAVALALGGIGFFIVYGMAYNFLFDRVMLRIEARRR